MWGDIMYKIYLNPSIINNFRKEINDNIDFSIIKKYNNEEAAWNSICAIMDRISDIVIYLNEKELNTGKWQRCAFDFFEFIEQAGVLIECIDELYAIYDIPVLNHKTIFKHKTINSEFIQKAKKRNDRIKDSDEDYFQYIRSLSSVHPSKTDRHKAFQNAKFEVSPYVVWNNGFFALDPKCKGEIVLVTYNNDTNELLTNKNLYINELFNFIKWKYYSLNYLTKKVRNYYNDMINNLRNKLIRKRSSYGSDEEYLKNLIEESCIRCPNITEILAEILDIKNQTITRKENQCKYNLYYNALIFSVKSLYRQLQNMDFNCRTPIDDLPNQLLLGNIYFKNNGEINYSYPLQKIIQLKLESGDKLFALSQYKVLMDFFNKYVYITEEDMYSLSYDELYVLSQIALYMHELENDGLVNKLIPNDEKYRSRL